uniref:Uncharacterized protein n=5 Tax=Aegilops tauschii subsp. strangulata TaxID=200361 RepID=A0A452ZU11_AEGTS
ILMGPCHHAGAASALDGGKGLLRDAAEAVKLRGAGALHLATRRGRMPVCVYLVWSRSSTDETGDTPLAHAIIAGTVDTFQYLLDHGANPDKPDEKGSTPLHLSASGGGVTIFIHTITSGATFIYKTRLCQ